MSREGNRYDNAPMESFRGILKNELVHRRWYKSHDEASQDITEYCASLKPGLRSD